MTYNKYDELAKLFATVVLFLASCYTSLLLVSSWLIYGPLAYAGFAPVAVFGFALTETLRRREDRSPRRQVGTSTFDDRVFPDDEKLERLVKEFLNRKKPMPWH